MGNDIFACGKNDIGLRPTILPLRGNDIHACGMNGKGLYISSDELWRTLGGGLFPNACFVFWEGRLGNDIFACGKNDIGLWPTILPLRGNDIHACGMNGREEGNACHIVLFSLEHVFLACLI